MRMHGEDDSPIDTKQQCRHASTTQTLRRTILDRQQLCNTNFRDCWAFKLLWRLGRARTNARQFPERSLCRSTCSVFVPFCDGMSLTGWLFRAAEPSSSPKGEPRGGLILTECRPDWRLLSSSHEARKFPSSEGPWGVLRCLVHAPA